MKCDAVKCDKEEFKSVRVGSDSGILEARLCKEHYEQLVEGGKNQSFSMGCRVVEGPHVAKN